MTTRTTRARPRASSAGRPPRGPRRAAHRTFRTSRSPGRVRGGTGAPSAPGRPDATELRLLAELLATGLPLVACLDALARHGDDVRRSERLDRAAAAVARGGSLAAALAGPDARLAALVEAGERVGRLADVLAAAADLEERLEESRRRIRAALAYPSLVATVAVGVVWLTLATVVPQMAVSLASLGGELPGLTRAVIRVADLATGPTVILVTAVGLGMTLLRRRRRGVPSRDAGSGGRLPGRLGRDLEVALVLRIAATLLLHGVPLTDALDVAGRAAVRTDVRDALGITIAAVRGGGRLAVDGGLLVLLTAPDRAVLAIGEDRGLLAPQFRRVADRHLLDVERRLDRVAALAEPLLVLVVGAVVGAVVAGLYLPSFRVLELL